MAVDTLDNEITMRRGQDEPLGRIDQYELLRELGGGGFGTVYLAKDTVAGIDVAVKGLPPLVKNNREEMANIRSNFALVSRLTHTNIAKALVLHPSQNVAYASDEVHKKLRVDPGDVLMVMEYAPGVTLSQWRKQFLEGKVPLDRAMAITRQIASALDYAHECRIVHRDIKPANVMIETLPDGAVTARVLDFGMAAEIRSSMGRVSREIHDTSGTRPYMAPEQWLGGKQGPATDQYSLAVLFCELLTGEVPFASVFDTGDPVVMMTVVGNRQFEPPDGIPRKVSRALAKALAKKPELRFASCAEFAAALEGRAKVTFNPAMAAVSALAVLAVLVCGACFMCTVRGRGAKPTDAPIPDVAETSEQHPAPQVVEPAQPKPAPQVVEPVQPKPDPQVVEPAQSKPAPQVVEPAQSKPDPQVVEPAQPKPAPQVVELTQPKPAPKVVEPVKHKPAPSIVEPAQQKTHSVVKVAHVSVKDLESIDTSSLKPGAPITVMLTNGCTIDLNWCPPGTFAMTSPLKTVKVGSGFWIGRYEVTQDVWERVMHENPSRFRDGNAADLPVDSVSRDACLGFVDQLNKQNGTTCFRLPLDAEWEYACRADSATLFHYGVTGSPDNMCCRGKRPCKVGSFAPNKWGLYDMHGNVSEWCMDAYPAELLKMFQNNGFILRGGSYADRVEKCSSNSRRREASFKKHPTFGMRLCFSVK